MKAVFGKFKSGLQRTKTSIVRGIKDTFSETEKWDDETFDDLEAALISADLGMDVSLRLVEDIKDRYKRGLISGADDIIEVAENDIRSILEKYEKQEIKQAASGPTVIMVVGANGSGKTTTCAKLAHQWQNEGFSTMLAACDTFRAAGVEQAQIWGKAVGCAVVSGRRGSDAAAVAYDAATAAQHRGMDILLVDTAGRQHTRKELMEELAKVQRSIGKACPDAPHEVWLTVDGSIGSNALKQVQEFSNFCNVTGLILTKLDGSGKGGVVVPVCEQLAIPIHYVGLGEGEDDLQPFEPDFFARALFED
ncbi:MAG: signal recognition particle-docking protein FtsY [Lentisphaeria bacterium]